MLRYPVWIITLITLLTLPLIYLISGLSADNTIHIWYRSDDPVYSDYQDFQEYFGSDRNIIVIYRNKDLISEKQLQLNRELTSQLSDIPGVADVASLSTIRIPAIKGYRLLSVPVIPTRTSDYGSLKDRIRNNPALRYNIISADGEATGMLIYPDDSLSRPANEILDDIEQILNTQAYSSVESLFTGIIPLDVETNRISGKEAFKFMILCVVCVFILLMLYFRNVWLAILPILTALLNVVWTIGIYAAFGNSVNLLTAIVPSIVFVISIALSVHIITRYQKLHHGSRKQGSALANALAGVAKPCFYSSLTTLAAFLAFLSSDMLPVRLFGFFTAIGIFIVFLMEFSFLPSILSLVRLHDHKKGRNMLAVWLIMSKKLAFFTVRRRRSIIGGSILIMVVAFAGLLRISFESDQMNYFRKSNEVRRGYKMAEKWFEGIYPLEIVFNLPDDFYKKYEGYMEVFRELEEEIKTLPAIIALNSPTSFFMNQFPDNEDKAMRMKTALAGRYINKLRKDPFLGGYLTEDGRHYRICVKTKWLNNKQTLDLIDEIHGILDPGIKNIDLDYNITGLATLYINLNERLMKNKIRSFVLSFLLIFILLSLFFKKINLAILGMIPNLAPLLTTLGLMGWLKIPLDMATILITAVSLGIAVDDTIHFISAYTHFKASEKDPAERIRKSFEWIGRPITLTTVLLASGFIIMVFSSYLPYVYFGIFITLNICLALLFDLLLLPAILYSSEKGLKKSIFRKNAV